MFHSSFLRKRVVLSTFLLGVTIWFSQSWQYRMNDNDVLEYFNNDPTPLIETKVVNGRSVRFLWMDNSKKSTVIFVHGAPGSATEFVSFFKEKKLIKNYNLLSIDRLGYGYSGFGNTVINLLEQAAVITELTKSLSLENVILLGHSLGAPIVAKAAMDSPDLFAGLILVGASVDPELESQEWYRPLLRSNLSKMILPTALYSTNEEIFHLKDQLEMIQSDWKDLELPMLIIHGAEDKLVPKENVFFLEQQLVTNNYEIWLESDVNHFIPWNRPDLIVNGILKLSEKL